VLGSVAVTVIVYAPTFAKALVDHVIVCALCVIHVVSVTLDGGVTAMLYVKSDGVQ
jgi:hypothetical protein